MPRLVIELPAPVLADVLRALDETHPILPARLGVPIELLHQALEEAADRAAVPAATPAGQLRAGEPEPVEPIPGQMELAS